MFRLMLAALTLLLLPLGLSAQLFVEGGDVATSTQAYGGYDIAIGDEGNLHALGHGLLQIPSSPRLELRLSPGTYMFSQTPAGFHSLGVADMDVGLKFNVVSGERFALGVVAMTSIPTGHNQVSMRVLRPSATFMANYQVNDWFNVAANLGATSSTELSPALLNSGLGVGFTAGERVDLFVDWLGGFSEGPHTGSLTGGLSFDTGLVSLVPWGGLAYGPENQPLVGFALFKAW